MRCFLGGCRSWGRAKCRDSGASPWPRTAREPFQSGAKRHDPTPDERAAAKRANEVTDASLLLERQWTPDQLQTARRRGFPRPTTRMMILVYEHASCDLSASAHCRVGRRGPLAAAAREHRDAPVLATGSNVSTAARGGRSMRGLFAGRRERGSRRRMFGAVSTIDCH
jgi:hypothetical protein